MAPLTEHSAYTSHGFGGTPPPALPFMFLRYLFEKRVCFCFVDKSPEEKTSTKMFRQLHHRVSDYDVQPILASLHHFHLNAQPRKIAFLLVPRGGDC